MTPSIGTALKSIPFNALGRAFKEHEEALRAAVGAVLDSGWFVHGPHHDAFEEELAAFVGSGHARGVASGTDALALALLAVSGGQRGDVVTAANAGGYTTAAAAQCGYRPVYADVDDATLCLTSETVEPLLQSGVVAVVVTHLYGRMADAAGLAELCSQHGVPLIEDCAQSIGAQRDGRRAGSVGTAAAFSFYPTKNLGALGDGGAVTTDDPVIAERVTRLRQYGWSDKYVVSTVDGRNSRLDEVQAAVLRVRLPRVDAWNERRREIITAYAAAAGDGVAVLPADGDDHVGHLAVARGENRDTVRKRLAEAGIATDVHYPVPDHQQPHAIGATTSLPVTERVAREIFSLPCFPQLSDDEVGTIADVLAGA